MRLGILAGAAALVLLAAPAMAQQRSTQRQEAAERRGVEVDVGGGVEAYTGSLAPVVNPGPTWAARLGIRPTQILGLELGYTGAVNNIDEEFATRPLGLDAPDLIRNGGQAVATVALTATPIQPYLLAGIGVSRYTIMDEEVRQDFQSDTTGNIPLGAGVRAQVGNFTADARLGYHVLFDQDFAANLRNPNSFSTGRYDGTLNFGATF